MSADGELAKDALDAELCPPGFRCRNELSPSGPSYVALAAFEIPLQRPVSELRLRARFFGVIVTHLILDTVLLVIWYASVVGSHRAFEALDQADKTPHAAILVAEVVFQLSILLTVAWYAFVDVCRSVVRIWTESRADG